MPVTYIIHKGLRSPYLGHIYAAVSSSKSRRSMDIYAGDAKYFIES